MRESNHPETGNGSVKSETKATVPPPSRLQYRLTLAVLTKHPSKAVAITPEAGVLSRPNIGSPGERVVSHVEGIGHRDWVIIYIEIKHYHVVTNASPDKRPRLSRNAEWVRRPREHAIDQRRYACINADVAFAVTLLPRKIGGIIDLIDCPPSRALLGIDKLFRLDSKVPMGGLFVRFARIAVSSREDLTILADDKTALHAFHT